MVLKEFPGNPVLPKKLFHVEKKNAKPNIKNYLPASFYITAKTKKLPIVEIKATNSKGGANKRTTRIRTKSDQLRKLASKQLADENADKDESDHSSSDAEDEEKDGPQVQLLGENVPDEKMLQEKSKNAPRNKAQKIVESLPKKGNAKATESKMRIPTVDEASDGDSEADKSIDDMDVEPEEKLPEIKSSRGTSGKRSISTVVNDKTSDDSSSKQAKVAKSDLAASTERNVEESNNEYRESSEELEEKPKQEAIGEKPSARKEKLSVQEEDTSVVLNVKRKSKRRR